MGSHTKLNRKTSIHRLIEHLIKVLKITAGMGIFKNYIFSVHTHTHTERETCMVKTLPLEKCQSILY